MSHQLVIELTSDDEWVPDTFGGTVKRLVANPSLQRTSNQILYPIDTFT